MGFKNKHLKNMFNKIILIFFALYFTLTFGQQKNSRSWDGVIANINDYKSHFENILITYSGNEEEHIDSLMIVNAENFEDISLELYTTVLEFDAQNHEKLYVIGQNYTITSWHAVELTDYGIILIGKEETEASKINTIQLTWVVDSKEVRRLIHDAFRYLIDANKVYLKKKRDANSCKD